MFQVIYQRTTPPTPQSLISDLGNYKIREYKLFEVWIYPTSDQSRLVMLHSTSAALETEAVQAEL
jgi:hypothetical protein